MTLLNMTNEIQVKGTQKNIKRFKIDMDYINLKAVGVTDYNLELLVSCKVENIDLVGCKKFTYQKLLESRSQRLRIKRYH